MKREKFLKNQKNREFYGKLINEFKIKRFGSSAGTPRIRGCLADTNKMKRIKKLKWFGSSAGYPENSGMPVRHGQDEED